MPTMLPRRRLLSFAAVGLLGAPACAPRASSPSTAPPPSPHGDVFVDIERSVGGRVGVFALDTVTGKSIGHREDERFAMCSTFKWALAAAVLARVDRGELALSAPVRFGASDLLDHAPVTRAAVAAGQLSVEALAEAAVTVSDNTAANLLLAQIGGPPGLTSFFRAAADSTTRLDRDEPTLNENAPGDPRDTTSPRAMVTTMKKALFGGLLSRASRDRLLGWLVACETGRDRLRAGFPPEWKVGDKTGTGARGAANDVAVAWPPGRSPILVASYLSDSSSPLAALSGAHAAVARAVVSALA